MTPWPIACVVLVVLNFVIAWRLYTETRKRHDLQDSFRSLSKWAHGLAEQVPFL